MAYIAVHYKCLRPDAWNFYEHFNALSNAVQVNNKLFNICVTGHKSPAIPTQPSTTFSNSSEAAEKHIYLRW